MTGDNHIGEAIDRKFKFVAVCTEHDHAYDDNHGMVLLAKDLAAVETLRAYREICGSLGAAPEQLRGIDLLIERFERYQAANPMILKVPDVDPTRGAHVLVPNR